MRFYLPSGLRTGAKADHRAYSVHIRLSQLQSSGAVGTDGGPGALFSLFHSSSVPSKPYGFCGRKEPCNKCVPTNTDHPHARGHDSSWAELTRVPFPCAARDFYSNQYSAQTLLWCSYIPRVQSLVCIHACAHVKNPKHWHSCKYEHVR